MLASRLARERGADDALLVTPHGRVLECPTASFFLVRDGEVWTAPLSDHVLDSITRRVVLAVADVREEPIDARRARRTREEAFVASSVHEVARRAPRRRARDFHGAGPAHARARGAGARADRVRAALMRIATVVGNRPQFVKAAAVCGPLRDHHEEVLIHTGQHHDGELSAVFFDELGLPDARSQPRRRGRLQRLAARAHADGARAAARRDRARTRVLLYGDTNSTLAGALAAADRGTPAIHVEAGMRSFDRRQPEERNRVLTDQLSALLLCSSGAAVAQLAARAGARARGASSAT